MQFKCLISGLVVATSASSLRMLSEASGEASGEGQAQVFMAKMMKYPGYDGDVAVTGTVSVSQAGTVGKLALDLNLAGLVEDGGIHIHSGHSCADADLVGGHFYTPDQTGDPDPWTPIKYTVETDGTSSSMLEVNSGYDLKEVMYRTVVVHSGPNKVACGVIGYNVAVMLPYPGYLGDIKVMGTVEVADKDSDTLSMTLNLADLEPSATGGVHIHVGTDCDTAGGHYWTPMTEADPWLATKWISDAQGKAEIILEVDSGYSLAEVEQRTVVVHSASSDRVSCGTIGTMNDPTTTEPTGQPTQEPTGQPTPDISGVEQLKSTGLCIGVAATMAVFA